MECQSINVLFIAILEMQVGTMETPVPASFPMAGMILNLCLQCIAWVASSGGTTSHVRWCPGS